MHRSTAVTNATPLSAALIGVLVGLIAAVQFSVPDLQRYGLATLYLWPIVLCALWFGLRPAIGVVGAVMAIQAAWYLSVAPSMSAGGGIAAVAIRGITYLFVGVIVGEFASRLRRVAFADPLTGLPNRRSFFEEVRRRSLVTAQIGIVSCDVDGLKQINDRDGHAAGDEAITRTAAALAELLGPTAYVCRFGGDEFVALTTPEIALRVQTSINTIEGAQLGATIFATTGGSTSTTRSPRPTTCSTGRSTAARARPPSASIGPRPSRPARNRAARPDPPVHVGGQRLAGEVGDHDADHDQRGDGQPSLGAQQARDHHR